MEPQPDLLDNRQQLYSLHEQLSMLISHSIPHHCCLYQLWVNLVPMLLSPATPNLQPDNELFCRPQSE